MSRPTFSIGVTTYNRRDLLKQCLETILAQEFRDYEVIVGNDYVIEPLTAEMLGICDTRVRIVNFERNLGELGNLNALLALAQGEYFTWQADDDYYDRCFLVDVNKALQADRGLQAIYTSYHVVRSNRAFVRPVLRESTIAEVRLFTGREFLDAYWRNAIKIMGLNGVYRTAYLRSIDGLADLGKSRIAIMSEWLIIIQSGQLEKVGYLERPLFYFRAHPDSWSASSADGASYGVAGINILRISIPLLQDSRLVADFESNLTGLLKLVLLAVTKFSARQKGGVSALQMGLYYSKLSAECRKLGEESLQHKIESSLTKAKIYLCMLMPSAILLSIMPKNIRSVMQRIRGMVSGEIHD